MRTHSRHARSAAATAAVVLLGSMLGTSSAAVADPPETVRFLVAGTGSVVDIPRAAAFAEVGRSRQIAATPAGGYVVATFNSVTAISSDGVVTPFAPDEDFSVAYGVAVESDGDVLVSEIGAGTITRFDADGTRLGEVAAGLAGPAGLALRGDELLVAVRGGTVESFASDGTRTTVASGLNTPLDVTPAPDGSILVSEHVFDRGRVVRVAEPGATPTPVASGLNLPTGIALDAAGGVYVAEFGDDEVSYVAEDGGTVEQFVGGVDNPVGLIPFDPPPTPQEITFTSDAPTDAVVGGAYEPVASGGGSGNEVTFSTTTPAQCSYDDESGVVSFVGAGTCTVAADQDGGTTDGVTYADAEPETQDVVVGKGAQVVSFGEGSPTEGSVGESFTPAATGGASGNPVTYSIDEDSTGVCEISDAEPPAVTYTATGTCVVNADQAGDDDYEAASTTPWSVAVDVAPTNLELVPSEDGLTASVTSPEGVETPSGEVTFTLDDETLGTADLVADPDDPQSAVAVLTDADPGTSGLLEASYAGDDTILGGSDDAYDRTAPTLRTTTETETPLNAAGWYRSPVTIGFLCETGTADLVGECPGDLSRANTNPGFRIDRTIVATDGGRSTVDRPLRVDTAAPVLDVRRVGRAPYARTARPIRCSAVDGRSGLDGACQVTYGRIVAGPGGGARRTWTATAADVAGNTSSRSGAFRVTGAAPRATGPAGLS